MLNVWPIYLHLGSFGGFHVGKYTIHSPSGDIWGREINTVRPMGIRHGDRGEIKSQQHIPPVHID